VLDAYELKARLAPALLVVAPMTVPLAALGGVGISIAGVVLAAGAVAISNVARSLGRRLEPGLSRSWGGLPTTALLRHRSSVNPHLRERAHHGLAWVVGCALPTADEEAADPANADTRYEAAVRVGIVALRDLPSGRLVTEENKSYGFHRNSYGLKLAGISAGLAGLTMSGALAAVRAIGDGALPPALVALGIDAALVWFWTWYVAEPRVREAAERYAEAFIDAAGTLVEHNLPRATPGL
jgi:hypothetical protein